MLAFGMESVAPFEFQMGSSARVGQLRNPHPQAVHLTKISRLHLLEETRRLAGLVLTHTQEKRKAHHDHHLRNRQFKIGDQVLLYQAKYLKKAKKLVLAPM